MLSILFGLLMHIDMYQTTQWIHSDVKHLRFPVKLVVFLFVDCYFHLRALTIKKTLIPPKGRKEKENNPQQQCYVYLNVSMLNENVAYSKAEHTHTHTLHDQMKGKTRVQNERR